MKGHDQADCEMPVKKRLMRLFAALRNERPAFPCPSWSSIQDKLPTSAICINPEVLFEPLLRLALELNHFFAALERELFEHVDIAIGKMENKSTKRFFTYRELAKKYDTIKEIFLVLYDFEYPNKKKEGCPPFPQYYNRLLQWKNTSPVKEWLKPGFVIKPARYVHFIKMYENPKWPLLKDELGSQDTSVQHRYMARLKQLICSWNQQNGDRCDYGLIHHLICFCLQRNREIGECLTEYEERLEYAGEIQFLLDPTLAEQITCISENIGSKGKEGIIQDLIDISMKHEPTSQWTKKLKRDTLRIRKRQCRKQYDQLCRTAIEIYTPAVLQKDEEQDSKILRILMNKKQNSVRRKKLIAKWDEVVTFLNEYEEQLQEISVTQIPKADQGEMLKKIFDVCRENRTFNRSEKKLKSYFYHLLRVNFFTALDERLKPNNGIYELRHIRFSNTDNIDEKELAASKKAWHRRWRLIYQDEKGRPCFKNFFQSMMDFLTGAPRSPYHPPKQKKVQKMRVLKRKKGKQGK